MMPNELKIRNIIEDIKNRLNGYYPDTEIQSFTRILLPHITGRPFALLLADLDTPLTTDQSQEINEAVRRLQQHEPIQYITGETEFMGLRFKVNRDTLIPRPETEELVELILKENQEKGLNVLDIGTGSGCIAVSLAKYMDAASVHAWDFSEEALRIADENAKINDTNVNYEKTDVFADYPKERKYNVIVSNPPYVLESEKAGMEDNVLLYEPHSALFVPDDKALIFYERIADITRNILVENGKLYFEINQAKGEQVVKMLQEKGFSVIHLHQDISKRDRMVSAILKN